MDKQDIIIIGAGISGLSLAHYCAKERLKTLVLEKTDRVGGTFHSHQFGREAEDFWLELGAHTGYNSYGNFIGILEDCHAIDSIIRRAKVSFKMLIDDNAKSILSQLDLPELLFSVPHILTLKKKGQSVESYYSKIMGRKNFEKVFQPAFNAIICQEADAFPADMLLQKRSRRKDIIKQYTFKSGMQTATDAIASQPSIKIKTGLTVEKISFDGKIFSVATNGGTFEASNLALSSPVAISAELLRSSFPEVSGLLAKIRTATVDSVGVAVKKEAVSLGPVSGLIPANDIFYSVVSRDTVPHEHYRGFTFHFKPGSLTHKAKLERIARVLGLRVLQLEFIAEKENYIPSLRVGHSEIIANVDRLLAGKPLFLSGNYFRGVAIEDCVSRSLSEFQRLKKSI
jgi:protoporphyrinogen/coproporphyrinogen III oxidase